MNAAAVPAPSHGVDAAGGNKPRDIRLPGYLSGWDVAEAFRAVRPDMPVIYASANEVEKTRRVPGSVFFTKPCRTGEILAACRTACRLFNRT